MIMLVFVLIIKLSVIVLVFGFFVCSLFLLIRNFMVIKSLLYWFYRFVYEWDFNNFFKEVSIGIR